MFSLVSNRYERASMIVTSNKPFSKWGEIFGDDMAATAMIDRLIHHSEILSLKGDSYRLRGKDLDARISPNTVKIGCPTPFAALVEGRRTPHNAPIERRVPPIASRCGNRSHQRDRDRSRRTARRSRRAQAADPPLGPIRPPRTRNSGPSGKHRRPHDTVAGRATPIPGHQLIPRGPGRRRSPPAQQPHHRDHRSRPRNRAAHRHRPTRTKLAPPSPGPPPAFHSRSPTARYAKSRRQ